MCRNILTSLYFFIFLFIYISAHTSCSQHSHCSCEYEDSKIINLDVLSKQSFLTVKHNNLTYYFHPCSNIKINLPNINDTNNHCSPTSLCLFNSSTQIATNIGDAKDAHFAPTSSYSYNIVYAHNNVTTVIALVCSTYPSLSVLHVVQSSKANHDLVLFSPAACPYYSNEGLSTGSILVILLMVFSAVYLIGGAAILHFLRGARGREMIPNIDFWCDLPLLVRDGAIFLQNGCKPIIPSSDSYDRI